MRIRTRIIGAALLAVLAVSVVNIVYFIDHQRKEALAILNARILENDRLLRVVIAGPLYDGNVVQLGSDLDSFFQNPDMVRISLKEKNGSIAVFRERAPAGEGGETIESLTYVVRGPDTLGEIRSVYSTALIERQLAESRNQLIAFSAALLLVLAIVIYMVARGLTGPIDRLTEAARAMAEGDLDRDIDDSGGAEELVVLGRSFTRMREAIKEKIAALAENNERLQQEMAERKRAADALRESEARLSEAYATLNDAIESAPAAIAIYDAEDRLIAFNSRFKGFFPLNEAIVRPGVEFRTLVLRFTSSGQITHPQRVDEAWLEERCRRHRHPAGPHEIEVNGNRWLQITETETRSGGIVSVYNDITALKEREEELQRLNEVLEDRIAERTAELAAANQELTVANRELESFSYSVSHDLRAPLRAMAGYSSILLEESAKHFDPESAKHLERIHAGAMRMGGLIDDLLRLSRIGRWEMNRQDFDFSSLATSAAAEAAEAYPEHRVEVAVEPGMRANGDPGLVHTILENLLGNAWKFSSRTDGARVEVGRQVRDGEPAYFVRDNGAGFNMAYADKLFRPFQRLHRPDEFEGTGIGLSIVQRAVARHGGRVWAESEEDRGATFWFTLGKPAAARAP